MRWLAVGLCILILGVPLDASCACKHKRSCTPSRASLLKAHHPRTPVPPVPVQMPIFYPVPIAVPAQLLQPLQQPNQLLAQPRSPIRDKQK
jgi:hypothetical protein